MKTWILVGAVLVLAAAGGAIALHRSAGHTTANGIDIGTRTATRTTQPSRTPVAPTPGPQPTPPAAAAALGPGIMVSECLKSPSDATRVIFLWTPSKAGTQYLDLSVFNNGFAPGTFLSVGGFGPTMYGYVWDGLAPGTTHFARVNSYTSAGWLPSQTLAFYTPICDPGAAQVAPAPDMLALRDSIADAIDYSSIDAAVAITDLQTDETVDVNGAATRLPGCTINLFGLMRVVVDLQNGKYPEPDAGDLIGQTINRSDPITARRLMTDWVGDGNVFTGIERVNDFMHALGMTSTEMDHPPAFPDESLEGTADNRITALDVDRGLQALWSGRVLNPFWRDYLLQMMTLVKPGLNYLIPVGTSAGATVSHKNGFLYEEGWADNDIGIVWYERGGERYGYAISFYTENVAGKYDDIPLGQQISSLAYQWFVSRYGYPAAG